MSCQPLLPLPSKAALSGSYRSIDFVLPHFANCGQHRTGIDRFECRIHGATSGLTIDDSTVWLAIVVAEFQELRCCELRCGECLNFSARCGHDLPDGLNGSEFRPDKILIQSTKCALVPAFLAPLENAQISDSRVFSETSKMCDSITKLSICEDLLCSGI